MLKSKNDYHDLYGNPGKDKMSFAQCKESVLDVIEPVLAKYGLFTTPLNRGDFGPRFQIAGFNENKIFDAISVLLLFEQNENFGNRLVIEVMLVKEPHCIIHESIKHFLTVEGLIKELTALVHLTA